MNRHQKLALINLCLAGTGLMFVLLHLFAGEWTIQVTASIAALIVCIFLFVSYLFRMIFSIRGGQYFDERDAVIHKTALVIGLFTLFIVAFLSIFISLVVTGFDTSITIGNLNSIFLLVILIWFITDSLAVLIQYSRGGKNGE